MDPNTCCNCDHNCHCSNGGSCCGGNCECMNCEHTESQEENSVDFDPDFDLTEH